MKKSILFFALAAISLTSCQKEEPTPNPTPEPLPLSSAHLFYVDEAHNYAHMEVYLSGNLVEDIQLTTSTSAPFSTEYFGSIYLYYDSLYTIKVRENYPGAPYFFEKTVTGGPTLTWGSGFGTNSYNSSNNRWYLAP